MFRRGTLSRVPKFRKLIRTGLGDLTRSDFADLLPPPSCIGYSSRAHLPARGNRLRVGSIEKLKSKRRDA
jgi:hypothetical protein